MPGADSQPPISPRFEVRHDYPGFITMLTLALIFLAVGGLMSAGILFQASKVPVAILLIGALLLLVGIRLGYRTARVTPWGRPALVLDADGLSHRFYGAVRWSEVRQLELVWVYVPRLGRVPVLVVELGSWARVRNAASFAEATRPSHQLRIALDSLDAEPGPILDRARALLVASSRDRGYNAQFRVTH